MNQWVTPSADKAPSQAVIDDATLDQSVVILLQGKNNFGDPIFSYVKLTLRSYRSMMGQAQAGRHFSPSDFGEVVAAGKGEPSEEIRREMAAQYNIQELDTPITPGRRSASTALPRFWGEDEAESGGDLFG